MEKEVLDERERLANEAKQAEENGEEGNQENETVEEEK